ncbi:MAG TPA: M20/M25/M40 family metallo-hydrolase [Thermoanaerobaculia bacterium]|nr:M20/M25/M40 family metallo-hydrolase [Thermoanaerobaculia bacterium]
MRRPLAVALLTALALPTVPARPASAATAANTGTAAGEAVDLDMITRIRAEGFERSQVMDTLFQLTDVIGPRLTGSAQGREASEWTRQQFAKWGLANAHLEPYPFGRGWSYTHASLRLVAPREAQLFAIPEAWTPGTQGPIRGPVVRAKIESEKDLAQYKGKLGGKILLLGEPREIKESTESDVKRYDEAKLQEVAQYELPRPRPDFRTRGLQRRKLRKALAEFLNAEKALATISTSPRSNGILGVAGRGSWEPGSEAPGVPGLVVQSETFDSLVRLVDDGRPVEVEIDVVARFDPEGAQSSDTLAEIPGGDKAAEVVMAGAHLDSWHGGTGTTDNAAGSAVVMEAVRILKAVGAKPRRTIRAALWTGEEQGLLGSYYYVQQHFASRPEPTDPVQKELPVSLRQETWPLTVKPEHGKLAAYFNLDNGSGKIRGIYAENNASVRPIFEAWLAPLHDLGADTVTLRATGGTDHQSFDRVGLPGFQFIQDELDYDTRTHHTNLDVYDRARPDDLKQAAVVLATFLYDAAMRPEPLPRKPLPVEPPKKEKKPAAEEKKEEGGPSR